MQELIKLHDQQFLDRQRIAGKCVGTILTHLSNLIKETIPNLSLLDLERETEVIFNKFECQPTFFQYKGFPGKICLSVNRNILHGIPTSYILQDGDVVKIDLGATYQESIADAATTVIYGKCKNPKYLQMIDTCKIALNKGIEAAQVGKQIGSIGYAISKYVSGSSSFGLITDYGGHGISINDDGIGMPHAPPFVSNKARPNEGVRIQPGMSLAIEPIVTMKDTRTKVGDDGWTISLVDKNEMAVHQEHTIYIHEDRIEIITLL